MICPHCGLDTDQQPEEIPYEAILNHLNIVCGFRERGKRGFTAKSAAHRKSIRARWAEGHRLVDFQAVHEAQAAKWLDTKWEHCLRPSTLYRPSNFEAYLNHGASTAAMLPDSAQGQIDEVMAALKVMANKTLPFSGAIAQVIYRAGGWLALRKEMHGDNLPDDVIRKKLAEAWTK